MNETDFFTGDRTLATISIRSPRGNAELNCTVFQRWQSIWSRTLACGSRFSRAITRQFGVSQTEMQELRSLVESSIGVKAVSSLKAEIEAKQTLQVKLDYSESTTDSLQFTVDKCDQRTIDIH